jgi:hypothetical protein
MSTTKKTNLSVEDIDFEEVNSIDTDASFSPFDEPVKEREYTKANIDASEIHGELEEPTFTPPSFSDFEDEETEQKAPFNQSYNELGNKEKQMGAEMIADVVIDGYSRLKKGMGSFASISENKLEREFAEGNINPSIELPIDEYGNTATIREFVKEFNETSKEAFDTPDDFKEKVKAPLIRVFKKRGLGMTDEQLLMYYFGTDFVTAGFTAFGLKKSADGILVQLREQTSLLRSTNTPPTPAPKNNQNQQASNNVSINQNEFSEPEEVFEVQPDIVAPKKSKKSNFASESQTPSNMPEFGNQSILNEIDKIASKETDVNSNVVKKRRGRPSFKK